MTIPQPASISDRLGSTLFFAVLVHGVVILGITFTAGTFDDHAPLPSLNVTLIIDADRDQPEPKDAKFLANRNHEGGGEAAQGDRPTTTFSGKQAVSQIGEPDGADLLDGTPREVVPSAAQLVSRGAAADRVPTLPQPDATPTAVPQKAATLIDQSAPQTLAAELDVRAQLPTSGDRTLVATPSTQLSILAEYLDGWRRRVERIGTANYPAALLGDLSHGRPTLEVEIGSDGALRSIVVQRTSGDKALDQAALKILRLAAPFEPLPDNVRAKYDVLRFAYEWDFFDDGQQNARPR